jgi:hypothetical protein
MKPADLSAVATLRLLVGYLGEKAQFGWWGSSFFSTSSRRFIDPVFGRTGLLARYHGVVTAAARVHDERIGTGQVYHLFRLPADVEQELHSLVQDPSFATGTLAWVASRDAALAALTEIAAGTSEALDGPVRFGDAAELSGGASWQRLAGIYAGSFSRGARAFPYFAAAS